VIRSSLRWCLDQVRKRLLVGIATREDLDRLYDQIAGVAQIQSALQGAPILKPLRHWAISPDTMAWILSDLQERGAPSIVEFGCGQSTVILAAWLKNRAGGSLLSFEHDGEYAAVIQRQLEACGLGGFVNLVVVPLVDRPAVGALPPCKTYQLPETSGPAIDLALIDGPPFWCGESTRYHALRWAVDRLAAGGTAYLDDTIREGERNVLAELRRQVAITTEELRAEKGLVRCRSAQAR
jgi:predicted O-methyltransferase YrrM